MCSFSGDIREYPGVVVDEFTTHSHEEGIAFFLSHAHSDHMKGLIRFADSLSISYITLYMTEITKSILFADTSLRNVLLGRVEIVQVNCSINLELRKGVKVTVTPLQTGHCPGAVMFLFEGDKGNILYTGDFRLDLRDLRETRLFRDETELIKIKTIYLDTTFCNPCANKFITREEAKNVILDKITEWFESAEDNSVCMWFPCLGYEYLIPHIHIRSGFKVNISSSKLCLQYEAISQLRDYITRDDSRIRIVSELAQGNLEPKVLVVKPSVQWFVQNSKLSFNSVYIPECGLLRVQHSNHSSYTEIIEFVRGLAPERIVPIATPVFSSSPQCAITRLKPLLTPTATKPLTSGTELTPIRSQNKIKRIMSSLLEEEVEYKPVCKKKRRTSC